MDRGKMPIVVRKTLINSLHSSYVNRFHLTDCLSFFGTVFVRVRLMEADCERGFCYNCYSRCAKCGADCWCISSVMLIGLSFCHVRSQQQALRAMHHPFSTIHLMLTIIRFSLNTSASHTLNVESASSIRLFRQARMVSIILLFNAVLTRQ